MGIDTLGNSDAEFTGECYNYVDAEFARVLYRERASGHHARWFGCGVMHSLHVPCPVALAAVTAVQRGIEA